MTCNVTCLSIPMCLVKQRVFIFRITSCVEELCVWLMKNMLKLDDSKTEFFIASSSHNTNRFSDINFQIGSEVITPSPIIKNLGITFDSAMNMSDYVTSLCKSVNLLLWNLARIRRFIDNSAASNAMWALILSGNPKRSWSPHIVPPYVLWRGPGTALSAASWTSSVGSPS